MYNVTVVNNTTADILNSNLTIGDYIIDMSALHLSLIIRGAYYSDARLDKAVADGKITLAARAEYKNISDLFMAGDIDDTSLSVIAIDELPSEIDKCYQTDVDYLKAILVVYNYSGWDTITVEKTWLGGVTGLEYINDIGEVLQKYTDAQKLILIEYL